LVLAQTTKKRYTHVMGKPYSMRDCVAKQGTQLWGFFLCLI